MSFTLLPDLTAFAIGFVVLALAGAVAASAVIGAFFSRHHTVRVRRHEGLAHYYGHLALGH